jgi:hypothetical protein
LTRYTILQFAPDWSYNGPTKLLKSAGHWEGKAMTWHLWLFAELLAPCTIGAHLARGHRNMILIAKYGDRLDWRRDPLKAHIGSLGVGAASAAIITALAGIIF